MGIATVAVYSDADATRAVRRARPTSPCALGGATPAESYLRGRRDPRRRAAHRRRRDPPRLRLPVRERRRSRGPCSTPASRWIGPSPEAIARDGRPSSRAKRLQRAAGVPILPGVDVDPTPRRTASASRCSSRPRAGGGGKGMRVVARPERARRAPSTRARARGARARSATTRVFLERYVDGRRHVEIQILGDPHGTVVHLGERECSVQRRHQKIIEEAPSPAVDAGMRERMGAAAVAAGEAIGYVGAGTVEFLLDGRRAASTSSRSTRASRSSTRSPRSCHRPRPRPRCSSASPRASRVPDAPPTSSGHAIEVAPLRRGPRRRTSCRAPARCATLSRSERGRRPRRHRRRGRQRGLGIHYDPMLAKVIAHAPTRREAARRARRRARAAPRSHGIATNRDFLVACSRHEEFLAGGADTGFLDRHDAGGAGQAPGGRRRRPARGRSSGTRRAGRAPARPRHCARSRAAGATTRASSSASRSAAGTRSATASTATAA